jgi:hypothetical protein
LDVPRRPEFANGPQPVGAEGAEGEPEDDQPAATDELVPRTGEANPNEALGPTLAMRRGTNHEDDELYLPAAAISSAP